MPLVYLCTLLSFTGYLNTGFGINYEFDNINWEIDKVSGIFEETPDALDETSPNDTVTGYFCSAVLPSARYELLKVYINLSLGRAPPENSALSAA